MNPVIRIARTAIADASLPLPGYATAGSAGADLRADLNGGTVVLEPGTRLPVPTGLILALPDGFEAQVRPRSGLALRDGVTVLNAPGTIDADYRGEVAVLLVNLGQDAVTISHGERIAQLVIAPSAQAVFDAVETVDATGRGSGGFGSTGRS